MAGVNLMKRTMGLAAAFLSVSLTAQARQEAPKVEQSKVDEAIKKGVGWLKKLTQDHLIRGEGFGGQRQNCELVLWTYVHAYPDILPTDPEFKTLLDDMLKRPLEQTYCVALQAMILEELHRVDYHARLKQCAQFLVDNQCANGQWSYGEPTAFAQETPAPKGVATQGKEAREFQDPAARGPKPAVKTRARVEVRRHGPAWGDNSNSQYAALGMRACYDAGIQIPAAVTDKAIDGYRKSQKPGEGPPIKIEMKDPAAPAPGKTAVAPVYAAEPQGWCYEGHSGHGDHKAYGSMSAGSVGSLAIWLYIKDDDWGKAESRLKRSWRKDKDVLEGMAWLAKNFSVTCNPGPYEHDNNAMNSPHQHRYYLYALERAGMLYGTERIGSHDWYEEGAKVLVESQRGDGAWGNTADTCFAILFLRRATQPLVASVDRVNRKP